MKTRNDIEAYLVRSGLVHQEIADDTWLVRAEQGHEPMAVRLEGPLVVVRSDVGAVPERDREAAFERMLRANAGALVHCSYGIEADKIILSAALPIENLDYNEFVSTLDDMTLAVARDRGALGAAR